MGRPEMWRASVSAGRDRPSCRLGTYVGENESHGASQSALLLAASKRRGKSHPRGQSFEARHMITY